MWAIKIITGEFCSRCHMISPLLKRYAEEHNMSFIEKDVKNASQKELGDATMLPIIYFWDEMVSFEDAFQRINE